MDAGGGGGDGVLNCGSARLVRHAGPVNHSELGGGGGGGGAGPRKRMTDREGGEWLGIGNGDVATESWHLVWRRCCRARELWAIQELFSSSRLINVSYHPGSQSAG